MWKTLKTYYNQKAYYNQKLQKVYSTTNLVKEISSKNTVQQKPVELHKPLVKEISSQNTLNSTHHL